MEDLRGNAYVEKFLERPLSGIEGKEKALSQSQMVWIYKEI